MSKLQEYKKLETRVYEIFQERENNSALILYDKIKGKGGLSLHETLLAIRFIHFPINTCRGQVSLNVCNFLWVNDIDINIYKTIKGQKIDILEKLNKLLK